MVFDWLLLFHELENYLLILTKRSIIQNAIADYTLQVKDGRVVHLYELSVQYHKEDRWIKIAESDNMMIFYGKVKKWLNNYIDME